MSEKTTAAYRAGITNLRFSALDAPDPDAAPLPQAPTPCLLLASYVLLIVILAAPIPGPKDKELLSEFIEKKREMFLLEYSLNVKVLSFSKTQANSAERRNTKIRETHIRKRGSRTESRKESGGRSFKI